MSKDNTQKTIEELISMIPREEITELVKAATKAISVEDIMEIAKSKGVELAKDQAETFFHMYSEEVPLPLDFLESVSGGASDDRGDGCEHCA